MEEETVKWKQRMLFEMHLTALKLLMRLEEIRDEHQPTDPDEPWDAWLLNIQLDKKAEDELIFTLEDGVLSASYFYYDADRREACDMSFLLAPEA